jgi:hypothetical protein
VEITVALPTTGSGASPETIRTVAVEAESRGWRTVWTVERLLFPDPTVAGASRARNNYRVVFDPWRASLGRRHTRVRCVSERACSTRCFTLPWSWRDVLPPWIASAKGGWWWVSGRVDARGVRGCWRPDRSPGKRL